MKNLGCAEFTIPGKNLHDKFSILERYGMWLEAVNDLETKAKTNQLQNLSSKFTVPIHSVQAFLLRRYGLVNANPAVRKEAKDHVIDTIKFASIVGAKNIVVVLSYGFVETVDIQKMQSKLIKSLREFGTIGQEYGVTISVESLGKTHTNIFPSMQEIVKIVDRVNSTYVKPMLDVRHIIENGDDIYAVLNEWKSQISEIHLGDSGNVPIGKGPSNFQEIIHACSDFSNLLCMEFDPCPTEDFRSALSILGWQKKH